MRYENGECINEVLSDLISNSIAHKCNIENGVAYNEETGKDILEL